eukprot:116911_1
MKKSHTFLIVVILYSLVQIQGIAYEICDGYDAVHIDQILFLVPRGVCIQDSIHSSYKLGGKYYESANCDPETAITDTPDVTSTDCRYAWSYVSIYNENEELIYKYPFITSHGSKGEEYCFDYGEERMTQFCVSKRVDIRKINYDPNHSTRYGDGRCWTEWETVNISSLPTFNDTSYRMEVDCDYYTPSPHTSDTDQWLTIGLLEVVGAIVIGSLCLIFCCFALLRLSGVRGESNKNTNNTHKSVYTTVRVASTSIQ